VRVALCGLGKAGKEVAHTILENYPDIVLTAVFTRPGSNKIGKDLGNLLNRPKLGCPIRGIDETPEVFERNEVDVVIDFSNHVSSLQMMMFCHKYHVSMVACTTGYDKEELKFIKEITQENAFGLVFATNITLGVNVLMDLARSAAKQLPHFDYQVTERHHRNKTDPISATSINIAKSIKEALPEKYKKEVPVNAVRAGGYTGYHEVLIVGENERISIIHESFSRKAFAEGAIQAAYFIKSRRGLYDMLDVLNRPK
jgi:4-hydroxy-tetrahydrodipicolinate reductase